jgi:DNA-binding Lrp family transcriptional regulator
MGMRIVQAIQEQTLTSGNQIAEALGVNGSSTAFRRTLKRLEAEKIIAKPGAVYVVTSDPDDASAI